MSRLAVLLSAFGAFSVLVFYLSGSDIAHTLSPQGCRMSWMSPSYVLQSAFDNSWTPFAKRYSLWLYREVGWETTELRGSPVLFIPGNAGSSHQVRSIASSAARQYFSSPFQVSPEFLDSVYKPLDFFALEFNEDLSAFHGPTLDAETEYAAAAIKYILSLYPTSTSVIVLAHSMGGAVATALLPHPNISAIITMSTPHTLPPARLDRRVDALYSDNHPALLSDSTPILSLCGGATDLMVPSESCILPQTSGPYRRTVFTSGLEGSWTGVGHREMVWCHQVRWRVARAALELTAVAGASPAERGAVLDIWLRDGHTLPAGIRDTPESLDLRIGALERLPAGMDLVLRNPQEARTYFLPQPEAARTKFVLYVRGSIPPLSPRTPQSLRASVFSCQGELCVTLPPQTLKLVPNPVLQAPFPVPDEGTDESEGVVVFEADVPSGSEGSAIVVRVENADGRGWVVGGFVEQGEIVDKASMSAMLLGTLSVAPHPENALYVRFAFPNLLSNTLVVYRLAPVFKQPAACSDSLLPPLLQHTSHPSENHYYPLNSARPIRLHTHAAGPYLSSPARGVSLTIYSSAEDACDVTSLKISMDWWGTLGRWGSRYASAVASWAIGVVALMIFCAWGVVDKGGPTPNIVTSLECFASAMLPALLVLSVPLSLIPFSADLWLGNRGEVFFVGLAPLVLLVATGAVGIVCGILMFAQWGFGTCLRIVGLGKIREDPNAHAERRLTSVGVAITLVAVLVFVPWQVAFLGCWIYHFYTCAAGTSSAASSPPANSPIPLIARRSPSLSPSSPRASLPPPASPPAHGLTPSTHNQNTHFLLLLTLLLPLAAPVLAVWVRTLATAGPTAPWNADHNVLCIAPAMMLVERAGEGDRIYRGGNRVSPRWGMLALALVAFLAGPRSTYVVSEAASAAMAVVVVLGTMPWRRLWSRAGG